MSYQSQISGYSNLCQAIVNRKLRVVYCFLRDGLDLNIRNEEGNTPLHLVIIHLYSINIIEMLLDRGVDIYARNHNNCTPLDISIQNENTAATFLLLQRKALVGEDLNQLLLKAVKTNNEIIVQMLIDHGMQDNPSINLIIHLKTAISQGNSMMIEAIIAHCGFSKPSDLYIPSHLVMSADSSCKNCVDLLLEWNFTIHPDSYNDEDFIYKAVENGYLLIIVDLLKYGIDVNMVNLKTGLNLLIIACSNEHYEIVEKFLQHNADVNVKVSVNNKWLKNDFSFRKNIYEFSKLFLLDDHQNDLNILTCLHIAVFNSDSIMLEILLKYGTKIEDYIELFNLTCYAVRYSSAKIVGRFLDYGVNVADTNSNGETLLHFCVNFYSSTHDRNYDIANLLLEKKADVHLKTPGNSLVFEAINNKHHAIAELFLHYNADVQYISPDGHTSLQKAITQRFDAKFIKKLLKLNSPVNTVDRYGNTPLVDACGIDSEDQLEIIKALLHYNADVNLRTPLHKACWYKNLQIIEVLLNKGANINAINDEGETLLHHVIKSYFKWDMTASTIQLLLKHGANIEAVDANGSTPLFEVYKKGDIKAIKCLLDNHANLYATNNDGQTFFHIVCKYSNEMTLEMIKLLLQHCVDIEIVDKKGRTPLLIACEEKCVKAVESLLENHANPNIKDNEGQTPLHVTCKSDSTVLVTLLLKYGANIEAVDKRGWTPLFIACNDRNDTTVEFLLDHYANPNHTDLTNSTPLHIVVQQKYEETYSFDTMHQLVKLLIKYGADVNILDGKSRTPLHAVVEKMISYPNDSTSYYCRFRRNYKKLIMTLISHGIKLKTAGLEVKNRNFNIVFPNGHITIVKKKYSAEDIIKFQLIDNMGKFKDECKKEIEKMKEESVGIGDLTFYDLLKGNIPCLNRLIKNEKIHQILKMNYYNDKHPINKFPLYSDIVKSRLRDIKFCCMSATEYFMLNVCEQLPVECVDEILNYLNIEEMKTFIKAMKLFND